MIEQIQKLSVKEAAHALGKPEQFVRNGLQQRVFPWGYAVMMGGEYSYVINRKRFEEEERL